MKNYPPGIPIPKLLLFTMRITFFLFFLGVLQTYAVGMYAQSARLSMHEEEIELEELFKAIEEQTDFYFFYNDDQIEKAIKVSIDVEDKTVTEILDAVLTNTGITYQVNNKAIILNRRSNSALQQQNRRITGTVMDENGDPVIAANVIEKGTNNGTVTDVEGRFSLQLPKSATLLISYIGYTNQELKVAGKSNLQIILREDHAALEEVVIVEYGIQKKEVVTGTITTMKAEDISLSPAGNMASGLAGRLSGVIINTRSGEAGNEKTSIFIRGRSSFQQNNNDPLYVIDGIARSEEGGILTRLDPEDIESITVLKDASAAIYGARAANGVILITTKRDMAGKKPTLSVSYNHSFTQPTRIVKMANSYSYARAQNMANEVRGLPTVWTDEELQKFADGSDRDHYPNTNWYKAVQKPWSSQYKANLQLSGGTDRVQYLVSAGLLDQGTPYRNGAMKNTMYNIRSNIDAKINDYIKITFDLFGKNTKRILPRNGSANGGGIYSHIGLSAPTQHAYWPGTKYAAPGWGNDNALAYTSGEAGYINLPTWVFNGQSTIDIQLPWVKGLSVKGSIAYDYFT